MSDDKMRESLESWKRWHEEVCEVLGLQHKERNCTLAEIKRIKEQAACDSQNAESDQQEGLSLTGDTQKSCKHGETVPTCAYCDSELIREQQAGEPVAYAVIDEGEVIEVQDRLREAEYLADQEGGKVVPLYGAQPQPDWVPCSERLPTETVPVLGYNADWVDGDFNPKGVRECVLYGDGTQWMTAQWCDAHDFWITTYDHEAIPTHWLEYPEPPGGKNE